MGLKWKKMMGKLDRNRRKRGGDKEMNDFDCGDSTDPKWMNDGLEGSEDEDIFAYVDKDVGVETNMDVETNLGVESNVENEPNASRSNEWCSDQYFEMHTLYGSSDEEKFDDRFAEFNEDVDMVKPKLKVGMKFKNAQVFRNALKEWQVHQRYDLKWVRNENKRITAMCKQECGFRIHASLMQNESTFQVKSLQPVHSCGRTYDNHLVTLRYLSQKYLERLKNSPNIDILAMQKDIHRELMVDVSKSQVCKAKRKAKETIEVDLRKHYLVIKLDKPIVEEDVDQVERPNRQLRPILKRLYVKLDTQKQGFLQGCKLVLGLDSCFLKSIYGGQAIGLDGNDNMFSIVIAAVEVEYKQKGLVHTVTQVLPKVEHRYCLSHFYTNLKQKFRRKKLKELMWKATKARTNREVDYHMKKLGELDKENKPNEWLMQENPKTWARSYFSTRS
ncbi:uncharacterized protein LOC114302516 [Camellia sinensis]|uniref:uncharacterized protein LOC114302516 n=1 Tax=Camellia sinensis TaxID=4442 RepID=UPI001035AA92|nr:uncharacterized protein LOC114302516 [Camellia sinensis]